MNVLSHRSVVAYKTLVAWADGGPQSSQVWPCGFSGQLSSRCHNFVIDPQRSLKVTCSANDLPSLVRV